MHGLYLPISTHIVVSFQEALHMILLEITLQCYSIDFMLIINENTAVLKWVTYALY